MPLRTSGNNFQPVGIEACFGVAFFGFFYMVEGCLIIFAFSGIDDPHAEGTINPGCYMRIRVFQFLGKGFGLEMAEGFQLGILCPVQSRYETVILFIPEPEFNQREQVLFF